MNDLEKYLSDLVTKKICAFCGERSSRISRQYSVAKVSCCVKCYYYAKTWRNTDSFQCLFNYVKRVIFNKYKTLLLTTKNWSDEDKDELDYNLWTVIAHSEAQKERVLEKLRFGRFSSSFSTLFPELSCKK